jgi:hypothetical protein
MKGNSVGSDFWKLRLGQVEEGMMTANEGSLRKARYQINIYKFIYL